MSQIVFLAQDKDMFHSAQILLHKKFPDISIVLSSLSSDIRYINELISQGTEILITRGGVSAAIKNAGLDITIVEIPLTVTDILVAIKKAQQYGKKIGIISYPAFLRDIDVLQTFFPLDLNIYRCTSEANAEIQTRMAIADGCATLVCGCVGQKFAKKYNCPFEFVHNGSAGILHAVNEAIRIAHARNLEKTHTNLFRTVINYAYEGIIAIDNQHKILSFNPQAERLTGITVTQAQQLKISEILPKIKLSPILKEGKEIIGELLSVQNVDILCNIVPLRLNTCITGAVITFQDVKQIQNMESNLRQRLYESGHNTRFCFKDMEILSSDLHQLIHIAKQFALTNSSILITGETGTGKEVFAQSIHSFSNCQKGPFIAINCAAIPVQILESELFGYISGAFTGASTKGKPGLFELAHNGTIFLDEIAEMEYGTQGKLLRVLQEKTVRRLGSDRVLPINVRIIAATNRNLKKMVLENHFRSDLYYRLNVLQLHLPPLRKRQKDIPLLATAFLNEQDNLLKRNFKLTKEAVHTLRAYSWPGNIRELKNIMERVLAVHKNPIIDESIIQLMLKDTSDTEESISTFLGTAESEQIRQILTDCRGNRNEAAKRLGISRSTLWRKLKRQQANCT